MKRKRRNFSPQFKAKVVMEALKERESINELAAKYELHPTQISSWKKEFHQNAHEVFATPRKSEQKALEQREAELFEKIGRLEMELDWLKKKIGPLK